MLQIIINLLLINITVVGITDMTDFPDNAKKGLLWLLTKGKASTSNYRFHLLDCSLCQTFWLSTFYIIYCLLTGTFSMWLIPMPILSALFTTLVYQILLLIKDVINTIIGLLNKLLKLINK